jgi:hypothetical protein
MLVKEIVANWLKRNGYDGLYCDDCGCFVDGLAPCSSEVFLSCQAGVCKEVDPGDGCGFCIGPKEATTNPDTGLMPEEQTIMDSLFAAYQSFCALDQQHPDDIRDVTDAIHRIQDILALRIVRRHYPIGWPIKRPKTTPLEQALDQLHAEARSGIFSESEIRLMEEAEEENGSPMKLDGISIFKEETTYGKHNQITP